MKMHAGDAKDRLPSQVSGGEAQRAGIARAMIGNPGLLFADEPIASLNGISYTANVIDEPERFHILEGRTCTADNEIVITEFITANFGLAIGDTVTVRGDNGSGEYIIAGIYSCANDRGDNFGMSREGYLKIGRDSPNLWCWHYFLADNSRKGAITKTLESAYGGDIHIHENTWTGLFGVISAMQALLVLMYALIVIFNFRFRRSCGNAFGGCYRPARICGDETGRYRQLCVQPEFCQRDFAYDRRDGSLYGLWLAVSR